MSSVWLVIFILLQPTREGRPFTLGGHPVTRHRLIKEAIESPQAQAKFPSQEWGWNMPKPRSSPWTSNRILDYCFLFYSYAAIVLLLMQDAEYDLMDLTTPFFSREFIVFLVLFCLCVFVFQTVINNLF